MEYFCFHTLQMYIGLIIFLNHYHHLLKKPACTLRKLWENGHVCPLSFHWFPRDELLPYSLTEINMLNTSQYH